MQDIIGTRPSKWCAGCHDHAVFFNGRFDRPIKEQIDTPEAQAGLGCMSCHAIVHVGSSMGNADFTRGVSAAARTRLQPQPVHPRDGLLPDLPQSQAAQGDLPEAVHARPIRGILLGLPQGAPRRSGEQLPLAARLQRLRQLAGQRRFRPGRAVVLLSAQNAWSAPIATCRWLPRTTPATAMAKCTRTASPPRIPRLPYANQDEAQLQGYRGLPQIRLHHGRYLRRLARRATAAGTADDAPQRHRAGELHVRRGRGGRAVRRRRDPRRGQGRRARSTHRRAPRARQHRARGCRGAHAQDRPLLPRRHRGRLRSGWNCRPKMPTAA